jgi:cytochrome c oxidase subunit 2
MFSGASNLAAGVDKAFIFIFATAFVFIVGITAFMIWTVIKYNRKKGKPAKQFSGSLKLEIIWTVIPSIIVLLMFYFGWVGFAPMRQVPEDAIAVTAIGRMWEWEFDYGEGKVSKELVVPLNKPVRLDLVSVDVNHSLFIPAFRVKEDVIPGYNNFLWFTATYKGEYEILCTEYCGLLHSGMISKARVVEEVEYNDWLANLEATGDIPDPEGLVLLKNNGCLACHSMDGRKLVGPSFMELSNERIIVENGQERTIIVDKEYLEKSIKDPNSQLVKGYARGLMQSYEKIIDTEDIDKMVEYLFELASEEK